MQTRADDNPILVTLHIVTPPPKKRCGIFTAPSTTLNTSQLIHELYEKFLKNDPLFHFFFEPDLIIRISKNEILEQIKAHLAAVKIEFDVYAYPAPDQNQNQTRYAENNLVMQRLYDIYLPLFHLNAIAALTMEDGERLAFLERSNHTFCNMAGDTRHEESEKLSYLASLKADKNAESRITAKR